MFLRVRNVNSMAGRSIRIVASTSISMRKMTVSILIGSIADVVPATCITKTIQFRPSGF